MKKSKGERRVHLNHNARHELVKKVLYVCLKDFLVEKFFPEHEMMIYASVFIIFFFIVSTLFFLLHLVARQRMLFLQFFEPEIYYQFVNQNKNHQ